MCEYGDGGCGAGETDGESKGPAKEGEKGHGETRFDLDDMVVEGFGGWKVSLCGVLLVESSARMSGYG